MISRALTIIFLFFATTTLASATGNIICKSGDGAVVDIQVSYVPILSIFGIEIQTGKTLLSTKEGRGEPIELLQQFIEGDKILIDVTDPNFENVVAQIRLFVAAEGGEQSVAGPMRIDGVGVFALSCEGP